MASKLISLIFFAFVSFTTMEGLLVWVNTDNINSFGSINDVTIISISSGGNVIHQPVLETIDQVKSKLGLE